MNVTTILMAVIAGLVALAGAGFQGYRLGADSVRAEYAARDIRQANEAAAATKALGDKYRAIEQAQTVALSAVSAYYQKRLTDAQAKTTIALNTIRANGLFDRAAKPQACGSELPNAAARAVRSDGETGSRLSDETANFLISEAARADAHTEQLNACISVLEAERK